jgi:uncharacterized protein (DUF433 family)
MQFEDYFDFFAEDDIRVKGTRIGIETILYEHLHCSQSPEAIAARYPSLSREQVYATITYYLHNEATVRDYLARWLEHGRMMREQQDRNPSEAVRRLRKLKAPRAAIPAEQTAVQSG